ncbi:hypothetical protein BC832DRAFT_593691 [Gaertneriomyces semiglobifer]|nr:hypothetical protein BC832DRAFT_593691 [Gaertneriomyces semiglobifer]
MHMQRPRQPSIGSLLNSAAQLERDFRQSLKEKGVGPFHNDSHHLRVRLRDELEQIILVDYETAASHDVEATLWKLVHYKLIEEFRRTIKDAITKARRSSRPTDERRETRALTANFRSFLAEATSFYLQFLFKLRSRFDLYEMDETVLQQLDVVPNTENISADVPISQELKVRVLSTCHRSLIYLGDLARYREIHADRKIKNWAPAEMFYRLAIKLMPASGNPFNQLAVIATYVNDELGAVERYIRSLATAQPFTTALENLLILFSKVAKKCESDDGDGQMDCARFVKRFICLHNHAIGKQANVEKLSLVAGGLADDFKSLLADNKISPDELLKIMIINIGVVYLISGGKAQQDASTASDSTEMLTEKATEFALQCISVLLDVTTQRLEDGTTSAPEETAVAALLPAVNVATLWLECQPSVCRAASLKFWQSYGAMVNAASELVDRSAVQRARSMTNEVPHTTETIDLQGFLPLHRQQQRPPSKAAFTRRGSDVDSRDYQVNPQMRQRLAQIVATALQVAEVPESSLYAQMRKIHDRDIWTFTTRAVPAAKESSTKTSLFTASIPFSAGASDDDDVEEVIDFNDEHLDHPPPIRLSLTASSSGCTTQESFQPRRPRGESAGSQTLVPARTVDMDVHIVKNGRGSPSAPLPVPGKFRVGASGPSCSPDPSGIFGTSADAVNTMAFLGLGSPQRSSGSSSSGKLLDVPPGQARRQDEETPSDSSPATVHSSGSITSDRPQAAMTSVPSVGSTYNNGYIGPAPGLSLPSSNVTSVPSQGLLNYPPGASGGPVKPQNWSREYDYPFASPSLSDIRALTGGWGSSTRVDEKPAWSLGNVSWSSLRETSVDPAAKLNTMHNGWMQSSPFASPAAGNSLQQGGQKNAFSPNVAQALGLFGAAAQANEPADANYCR